MTLSITKSRETRSVISKLAGIENKTPEEAHKAISVVLYNQYKAIEKLREDNKLLWLQIQKQELNEHPVGNTDSTQAIMKRIWDNKEDKFWDTF